MKRVVVAIIGTVIFLLGCGVKYEVIDPGEIVLKPVRFESSHVIITGIPQQPDRRDFQCPTSFFYGNWYFKINGQLCHERVKWENFSRILACRNLFERAVEKGEKITIAGQVRRGIVELESLQDLKTDTPWYERERPFFCHSYPPCWRPVDYP